jgi:hypothetical protein
VRSGEIVESLLAPRAVPALTVPAVSARPLNLSVPPTEFEERARVHEPLR